jgi:hypothetical protein
MKKVEFDESGQFVTCVGPMSCYRWIVYHNPGTRIYVGVHLNVSLYAQSMQTSTKCEGGMDWLGEWSSGIIILLIASWAALPYLYETFATWSVGAYEWSEMHMSVYVAKVVDGQKFNVYLSLVWMRQWRARSERRPEDFE